MWRMVAAVWLAGCGRLHFDALGDGDGATGSGTGDAPSTADNDADPLGPFGMPTQVLALGAMRDDENPSLTDDLLEIYFDSNRNCGACYDLFMATRPTPTSVWNPPIELAMLDSAGDDLAPEVSGDGLTLWFSTSRGAGADIWVSTRSDRAQAWGTPVREDSLSTAGADFHPALSEDELVMMMTSEALGQLYIATRPTRQSPWSTPAPLGEVNDEVQTENAGSLRDGNRELFFDRSAAFSAFDIWVASRATVGSPFGEPLLVGGINSSSADLGVWVSRDRRTLYFSSDRTGDMEIYESKR